MCNDYALEREAPPYLALPKTPRNHISKRVPRQRNRERGCISPSYELAGGGGGWCIGCIADDDSLRRHIIALLMLMLLVFPPLTHIHTHTYVRGRAWSSLSCAVCTVSIFTACNNNDDDDSNPRWCNHYRLSVCVYLSLSPRLLCPCPGYAKGGGKCTTGGERQRRRKGVAAWSVEGRGKRREGPLKNKAREHTLYYMMTTRAHIDDALHSTTIHTFSPLCVDRIRRGSPVYFRRAKDLLRLFFAPPSFSTLRSYSGSFEAEA